MEQKEEEFDLTVADIFSMFSDIFETPRGRRKKRKIPKALRWEVWLRDNFTCKYCGVRRNLSIDHKVPESQGGTDDMFNLLTACKSCNSKKHVKSYQEVCERLIEDIWYGYDAATYPAWLTAIKAAASR